MANEEACACYYRKRAERIRAMAREFRFPEARAQLEAVAVQFDYLAFTSEERERAMLPSAMRR
ncbi:MAG TPA: hypothetical protein VLV50_12235 [Stellaceae bacterium]|nr:hypothetical protein [Stellaceae bacterium]